MCKVILAISTPYHADGGVRSLTDASGKPVFYEYDWRGKLPAVKDGNRILKSGSRIGGEGKATEHKVSYIYDRVDRLVSETRQGEETAYVYDLCGNRLKKLDKSGEVEYHYNRKNQLICHFSEKEKTAYRYDLQGNLLEAAGAEGTTVFSYNVFHQQTAVTMSDGKRLENQYDAEYLRAGMVENGTVTTFSYHNGELLAESSPEGDTISRYISGYGVAAGWNREKSGYHYYHLDEQNSTAYITGRGGEIENQYEYDAFGVLQNSREEFHNRILYTGQQYDQTSGQYYLRARYYNPVLGRFVQEDEYRGDGLNLYAYCKNNPVVYYDPSGFSSVFPNNVYTNDNTNPDSYIDPARIPGVDIGKIRNKAGIVTGNFTSTVPLNSSKIRSDDFSTISIPPEIAQKLVGKQFNSMNDFRSALWKEIGNSKYAKEFCPSSQKAMKKGFAPYAPNSQKHGGLYGGRYSIDHEIELQDGGYLYDMDNMTIRSPGSHNKKSQEEKKKRKDCKS